MISPKLFDNATPNHLKCFTVQNQECEYPKIEKICFGFQYICEELLDLKFRISPTAFFQGWFFVSSRLLSVETAYFFVISSKYKHRSLFLPFSVAGLQVVYTLFLLFVSLLTIGKVRTLI